MIRGRSCKNFEDPRVERVWKSLQKQLGQKTASILLDLVLNKIYDLDIIKASLKKLYDAFLVLETKEESLL